MSIETMLVYAIVAAAIAGLIYVHRGTVRKDLVIGENALEDYIRRQDAAAKQWAAEQLKAAEEKAKAAVKAEVSKVI